MATIVRIKRRITEDPVDAFVISRKRVKTEENEVETVLRFVGTVKHSTGETLGRKVLEAIKNEQLKPSAIKEHKVDLKSKLQTETRDSSKANRLKLVTSFRPVDAGGDDQPKALVDVVDAGGGGDGLQYNIFDIIPDDTNDKDPDVKDDTSSAITCNDVVMMREEFVYDLYFTEMEEFKERLLDFNFCIEKVSSDPDELVTCQDDDDDVMEGDEDSNDENDYRNDYPDEDSDFEKERDYYGYEDEDDEEIVRGMRGFYLGDQQDDSD